MYDELRVKLFEMLKNTFACNTIKLLTRFLQLFGYVSLHFSVVIVYLPRFIFLLNH